MLLRSRIITLDTGERPPAGHQPPARAGALALAPRLYKDISDRLKSALATLPAFAAFQIGPLNVEVGQ